MIGFWLNFNAVSFFDFQDFKVSILVGLLFPLMIALFWGWKYGLLSALFGGCQSMWWLWYSDGYGILYSVPVFILWIVWHGLWADYRKTHQTKWYHNIYVMETPFRIASELGFYTLFRWLVSLNPPPWGPAISNTFVPYSWVHFVAIKHVVTAYILLLIFDVLKHLKPVSSFFIPEEKDDYTQTTYIISLSLLIGFLFWIIHGLMDYLIFFKGSDSLLNLLFVHIPITSMFSRNLFLLFSLTVGVILSKIQLKLNLKNVELLKNETLLNQTQEIAQIAGWEYDVNKKVIRFTQEVFRIFGWSKSNTITLEKLTDYFSEEDKKKFKQVFQELITRGRELKQEIKITNIRNAPLWIQITGQTILNQSQQKKIIGNIIDITERKKAEGERKKYRENLEHQVQQRTRDLKEANTELEAFAYSVSHDLRAPLRHIDGFAQLLKRKGQNQLDEKGVHYLDNITESSEKMGQLIDDLLAFSRIGRAHLQKIEIDLDKIIQDAKAEVVSLATSNNIHWTIESLGKIKADPNLLKVVFLNLFSNAVKFSQKQKEIFIEVGKEKTDEQKAITIYVRDNGAGFDMRYQEKLFGVFQRLHSEEEFPGTGVGLATVRRIISRHGGQVWAKGEPDKGATFYFSLPNQEV